MLSNKSTEDIVSHLYVTEAYYFNPKQVKRSQLLRLVGMIQDNLKKSGALQGTNLDNPDMRGRRNYFDRKRWINHPNSSNYSGGNDEKVIDNRGTPPMEQRSGATNANALNQRKRFDDLRIQNKGGPSVSPTPDMPAIAAMPKLRSEIVGKQ